MSPAEGIEVASWEWQPEGDKVRRVLWGIVSPSEEHPEKEAVIIALLALRHTSMAFSSVIGMREARSFSSLVQALLLRIHCAHQPDLQQDNHSWLYQSPRTTLKTESGLINLQ